MAHSVGLFMSANIHFLIVSDKNGDIFYTCHTLIISYLFNGEKWSEVYKRNFRSGLGMEDNMYPEFYD